MFRYKSYTENEICRNLLADHLPASLGFLYENAVAQALAASGNQLFCHTWKDEETDRFSGCIYRKYSSRVGNHRCIICTKDYAKEGKMTYLPIYMTRFLGCEQEQMQ